MTTFFVSHFHFFIFSRGETTTAVGRREAPKSSSTKGGRGIESWISRHRIIWYKLVGTILHAHHTAKSFSPLLRGIRKKRRSGKTGRKTG